MDIDFSGAIASLELSIDLGQIKPEVSLSATTSESAKSESGAGASTILDLSSKAASAIYKSGPVVLIPKGNKYIPEPAGTIINGISAPQIKGAITLKDGFQYDVTSSSVSLYTAAGISVKSSQTSLFVSLGMDPESEGANSKETLIAKLFSNTTEDKKNVSSYRTSA